MAAPNFSDDPTARGFYAPMRFDAEVYDCEVEGELPSDLAGTFFRVGPNRTYPQRFADDIPFNGDGMASYFRIANGHCDYMQKYVKTQRYLAETKARRALFGRYRNRHTNEPSVEGLSLGTANTHIVWHGGKLMALKEDSPPVLLDPHTLETLDNYHTFGGQLTSLTFSAHPKIDVRTGELIAYGYEAKGDATTDINIMTFDAQGQKTWEVWINSPYVCMMHDCAVTDNYILIPTTGYTTTPERLQAGLVHWGYDESLPIYLIVVPRGGEAKDVRMIQAPHRCIVHTVSAVERNGALLLDSQVTDGNTFPFFFGIDGSPWNPAKAESTIRRWTVDPGAERLDEEVIFPQIHSGLPRIDDRYISRDYRYGYSTESASSTAGYTAGGGAVFARFDLETGEVKTGGVGEGRSLNEVLFAPRSPDAPEGDGYLLSVADVPELMRSELVVVDAQRPEEGVIARVILPFRAHGQVHGSWVSRADLDFPESMTVRPA